MLVMTFYVIEEIRAGRMTDPAARRANRSDPKASGQADDGAEAYLRRGMLAPYALGLRFLARGDPHAFLRGTMSSLMDRAFEDPPRTTREILNPLAYWWRDENDRVASGLVVGDLSDVLGAGWELIAQGQLGEINVSILGQSANPQEFNPFNVTSWSGAASNGLVADTYHHYARGDEHVTILTTSWRGRSQAREFRALLRPMSGRRTVHAGMLVALIAGTDAQTATRLAGAAFSRATLAN